MLFRFSGNVVNEEVEPKDIQTEFFNRILCNNLVFNSIKDRYLYRISVQLFLDWGDFLLLQPHPPPPYYRACPGIKTKDPFHNMRTSLILHFFHDLSLELIQRYFPHTVQECAPLHWPLPLARQPFHEDCIVDLHGIALLRGIDVRHLCSARVVQEAYAKRSVIRSDLEGKVDSLAVSLGKTSKLWHLWSIICIHTQQVQIV